MSSLSRIGNRMTLVGSGLSIGGGKSIPSNALRDADGVVIKDAAGIILTADDYNWSTRYPSALAITDATDTTVTLGWTNNGAQDYDDIEIAFGTVEGEFPYAAYADKEATTAIVTGLASGTDYYIKARYRKGASYSAFTEVVYTQDWWNANWSPSRSLAGETPDFWIKENSRTGLTLADSVNPGVKDISILPSYVSTYNSSAYAYINDNGALDIYDSDFTICGWVNVRQNTSAVRYIMGKTIAGGLAGRYAFYANITTGYIFAVCQSSGTTVNIGSTINASTAGPVFLLMDVNQTSKKVRFFAWSAATGYNQIGADTSFTGTFPHLDNAYRFYMGCCNTVTTGAAASLSQSDFADVRIFSRILNPTEQTTLVNRGSVATPKAYFPCNNILMADSSGNGYHLTTTAFTTAQLYHGTFGSRQGIDVGYTRHTKYPNLEIQIPYTHTNVPCAYTPTGYTLDANIPGDTTNHNGADSFLIPVAGTMDRSDATPCRNLAREVNNPFFYSVAQKTGLHAIEATNRNISSFFNTDYRGKDFIKRNGRTITDWVHYATNKTGADYNKAITWTGENMNFAFGSGNFVSMGIYSTYISNRSIRMGASTTKNGAFTPIAECTMTGASITHVGNANMIPLNTAKCNGTTPPVAGETNFLMAHETMDVGNQGVHLWKSHNAIDWTYVTKLPTIGGTIVYMESWFIDNNDPTDWHNIHYIGFNADQKKIYESHPLNSNFTSWSDFIEIFAVPGGFLPYNAIIWKMGDNWHMFYSAYHQVNNTHYMHHAQCTHDPFTASNDWQDIQTGNWSGLGSCESYTLINTGGSNWILYFWELVSGSHQRYSLSTDDCATWSASTIITTMDVPLMVAVYYNNLN